MVGTPNLVTNGNLHCLPEWLGRGAYQGTRTKWVRLPSSHLCSACSGSLWLSTLDLDLQEGCPYPNSDPSPQVSFSPGLLSCLSRKGKGESKH